MFCEQCKFDSCTIIPIRQRKGANFVIVSSKDNSPRVTELRSMTWQNERRTDVMPIDIQIFFEHVLMTPVVMVAISDMTRDE